MAQYQRFLSYLFEYEGDQKKENCGFAKIEIRGDVQRIFLSVKNNEQAEILHVFGFYHTKDGCDCVPLGRMVVKNGKGQLQYINNGVYLAGSKIKFEQLSGIVAGRQKPFSNAYATVWDDQYFGLSLFDKDRAKQTAQSEDEQVLENQPQEELQTMEVCCETDSKETNKIEQGQDKADAVWAQLSTAYQHIETLPGDTVVCLKVMPADIGRLPRPNWMLSNNGFLMYSFVKYRYIVFAKVTQGRYELWVPGNYEKSEELMAQMFGFYCFRSVKSKKRQQETLATGVCRLYFRQMIRVKKGSKDDSCRSTKNGESCIWLKTHQKQKKGKTMATENEQLLEEQARLREKEDRKFMRQALTQAKKAAAIDEVPIGCVIVCDGKVIARGYNRRNIESSVLGHAELAAMKKASKKLGDWRLEGCTMYVTLEPCQMCAGAAVQARLDRVVIGAMNAKAGCAGSIINLLDMQQFNHQIPITKGVLEQECSQILSEFFKRIRVKKKKRPLTNEEISDTIMDAQPGR